jgi:tRNA (guanine-N7-)-methyltransferase
MSEESQNLHNNRLIRSFGRIKSRKLSDHKTILLEDSLANYEVNFSQLDTSKNILEIGFGFGDFLFEKAKNNPQNFFYGSEPHINGVVNLLAKLEKEPLSNLKVSRQDVRLFLSNFPDGFFEQIYILFPDPWPKAKHFKRRLINQNFLDSVLTPKMKEGAKLTIATDHDSYKTWILAEIAKSKNFTWEAKSKVDWQTFPNDWTITKYQKKAAREGRVSIILNLIRQ